jgi:MFS family permease
MIVLFAAQALFSAAFVANSTVNPIAGQQLSGITALSGLPGTLVLIGAAYAAFLAGRIVPRLGWRQALAVGFVLAAIGMGISAGAIIIHSFALFLIGLVLTGGARGFVDLSRYAAADANEPQNRAKAISAVVWAGTIGAIGGPALVGPMGELMARYELDKLSGPFVSGVVLCFASAVIIWLLLRPDPREIAQQHTERASRDIKFKPDPAARTVAEVLRQPIVQVAVAALVVAQAVMTLIMSQTSLHMFNHAHPLDDASFVIMIHVLGMYGLSPVIGALADRIGRIRTIVIGSIVLVIAALLAPVSLDMTPIAVALFLLGIGWNMCYIGGSSLLADSVTSAERSKVQGTSDLIVNLTSASSSLGGGVIVGLAGYGLLCLLGAVMSLVPLVLSAMRRSQPVPQTEISGD